MSSLVLDAGVFIAVDRNDRSMIARLRIAHDHGLELRSHAMVIAQIWRDSSGRQARVAQLLKATCIETLDEHIGRASGILLGSTNMIDPIDAAIVLISRAGDRILTSDPDDIQRLAQDAPRSVRVIAC